MFGKRNLGNIWKPKNPHSLEYLKYLHGVLNKNAVVTETNRGLLVEALRAIAEILIWGDQNDPSVFDFFLEKNMLGFFLRIMKQKCGRYVCTQLLQTLNILFENISNETSLYYLLSNNHVNSIITHRFDFSDEEILAYYISFLKTLSLKLNGNTIHFFFNEHTNDFPLYTEAIKFFNHSESMVRIAVRTLTLNVYRVNDPAMLAFIRDNAAAPYFSNFVFFIVNHIVDIDSCLAAAEGSSPQTRSRLSDLVAEHLDHIHYVNDVLHLGIGSLNAVLSDQLLKTLFVPIYLGCLSSDYRFDGAARVSPMMALFLLSQVFLVVTYAPLIERVAGLLLVGDHDALLSEGAKYFPLDGRLGTRGADGKEINKTDDEKLRGQSVGESSHPLVNYPSAKRPLLRAVLNSLDCRLSDHLAFFAVCLINSIYQNSGVPGALLQCVHSLEDFGESGKEIVRRLVEIISRSVEQDCKVRIATMEACCATLKLVLTTRVDGRVSALANYLDELRHSRDILVDQLRQSAQRDDIFLDLFEDEYRQIQAKTFSVTMISADAAMLLAPFDTPLSGVEFAKRLPCGPQEQTRHCIRVFLLLRQLLRDVGGERDDFDRTFGVVPGASVDDCLNLSNSDLLACTVVTKDGSRCQRFLVTGGSQLMLVEPDGKKLGWGVVRFAGSLQNCEVAGDKDDSRALNIVVMGPPVNARTQCQRLLSARLVFDDHIRCMAAKQRLTKGRQLAREHKMSLISRLLRLCDSSEAVREIAPSPPPLLAHTDGRQVPGYVAVDRPRHQREGDRASDEPSDRQRPGDEAATSSTSSECRPQAAGARRSRVRVLSAESIARDGGQCSEEMIQMQEMSLDSALGVQRRCTVASDSTESFPFAFISKRSNSLSPRVVPRFGVEDPEPIAEDDGGSSPVVSGFGNAGVGVREDASAVGPSLQCFVGKRKTNAQVLDI